MINKQSFIAAYSQMTEEQLAKEYQSLSKDLRTYTAPTANKILSEKLRILSRFYKAPK